MLRLVGALLLTSGAAGLGLCAAGQLGDRVRSLRSLVGGLEILRRELSFRRTAMPELMERTARQSGEPARYLFARCRDHLEELGERSFGQIWARAVEGVRPSSSSARPASPASSSSASSRCSLPT